MGLDRLARSTLTMGLIQKNYASQSVDQNVIAKRSEDLFVLFLFQYETIRLALWRHSIISTEVIIKKGS